jgi:hypothetical protein
LIGEQHDMAAPWTRSKVEPDPEWAHEGVRAELQRLRLPFRHEARAVCGQNQTARGTARPPHCGMHGGRDDRRGLDDRGPRDEQSRRSE